MRYFALIICLSSGLAQIPAAPTNLRLVATATDLPIGTTIAVPVINGTNNPFGIAHRGLAAWWQAPDTNVWFPESSINNSLWEPCGNRAFYPGDWRMTETTTNLVLLGTNQWQVRIKRIR